MVPPKTNIVLMGFMGAGKTSVGRELATRLNRPFIDIDEEVERVRQKTIAGIFAEEGEAAFRGYERQLIRDAAMKEGCVIACGGGAILDDENVHALQQHGLLICLTASASVLFSRCRQSAVRPLLDAPADEAAFQQLWASRQPAYAAIPIQIDTTKMSIPAVVDYLLECKIVEA